jgi:pimeloyl-ACP methyl ester carboxylesterase/SAM-dependent methyltransferase
MSEIQQTPAGTLKVPGATLHYCVHGTGPMLLLLPGGAGDAEGASAIARYLADSFTTIAYDRRGISRSKLEEAPASLELETHSLKTHSLETHSDDAHRLLAALTTEPAFVFGASIGALIGLDLVSRHPEQLRKLVALEPPSGELLPDAARARAEATHRGIQENFRSAGMPAAMKIMGAASAIDFTDREPDVELPQPTPQRVADLTFFLTYDEPAVYRYRLDIAALKRASSRIVPAAGLNSGGGWPHESASGLAERLHLPLVEFPGGHTGYNLRPRAFAAKLREVLSKPPRFRRPEDFNLAYSGSPAWDIGRPQPIFVALAEAGELRGRVLDAGCGTGEHTLLAARMGLDATGIDAAPAAISLAEGKAQERGIAARFLVHNALQLEMLDGPFDTVLDSGLFHVFGDDDRRAYVASLKAAIAPGGRYFMACFSDRQPGDWGPRRVSEGEIRASFADGWSVDSIEPAEFEIRSGPPGAMGWLARITRV